MTIYQNKCLGFDISEELKNMKYDEEAINLLKDDKMKFKTFKDYVMYYCRCDVEVLKQGIEILKRVKDG